MSLLVLFETENLIAIDKPAGLLSHASVDESRPDAVRTLVAQLGEVEERTREIEAQLLAWHRTDETSRRLTTIPG